MNFFIICTKRDIKYTKVMLIERLSADPENRAITSDAEVVDFGMTTSDSYTGIVPNQKVKRLNGIPLWFSIYALLKKHFNT